MAWSTLGVLTNAVAGALLADTGALAAGTQNFTVVVWTDIGAAELELAKRDATNTIDVTVQRISVQSGFQRDIYPIVLVLNERVIVRVRSRLFGNIQVSILS